MAVQHGFVRVDCNGRMHLSRMLARYVDGRLQIRQLAARVDNAFHAYGGGLVEQLAHAVYGNGILPLFLRFMAHGLGKRHHGGHMRVVVDNAYALGQARWRRSPASVAMMFAHVCQCRSRRETAV